eukprot:356997_1
MSNIAVFVLIVLFQCSEASLQPTVNPTLEPTSETIAPVSVPTLEPTYDPTTPPVTTAQCNGFSNCWAKIIKDYGFLSCDGKYACSYASFICKEGSTCHLECADVDVYGSHKESGYSCSDMTVDGRYAKLLTITSTDIYSTYDLQNTRIYCPIQKYNNYNYSCVVNYASANRQGSDFINVKFYTVNGFTDIDFRGNIPGLATILSYNISVFYGDQYEKQCIIKMDADDSLVCINIDSHALHNTTTPTTPPSNITTTPAASDILSNNPLFCRGYHFLQDSIAGSNVIDCNDNRNVDAYNDIAKSCQYSSLSFSTAYSSYESYSDTDSVSISNAFTSDENSAAGSLSYSRTQTATTIKNSQSYIYRLDFSCVERDISLLSYPKVQWDDDFLNDLQFLPTEFDPFKIDTTSYERFINFWKIYGTHIIQSAKLGGKVFGTVVTDYCSVTKQYSSLRSYTVCLNGEFNGAIPEGDVCENAETAGNTSTSAQYSVSKTTLNVKGGDSSTFGEIVNKFGDTSKQQSYNEWIASLSHSPYVIGGNLQEIYSVIKDVVNSNTGVGGLHGMNKYCDDTKLLQIANAMKMAYHIYVNRSISQDSGIECSFSCGKGKLNTKTCQCQNCKGADCCDDSTDYGSFYEIHVTLLFVMFVFNILI